VNAGGIASVVIFRLCGGALGDTVTAADALLVESATLIAVTVTFVVVLTVGAVKKPEEEIVPALAFHVTPV
jgi:hypothetical protein